MFMNKAFLATRAALLSDHRRFQKAAGQTMEVICLTAAPKRHRLRNCQT
jgi:hypothetical protein